MKLTLHITVFLSIIAVSLYGQDSLKVKSSGMVAPMAADGGGGTPPPTPGTPTVSTNVCGDKIVTRTGTPPSGVQWYWQTTVSGVDDTNSAATYTVSADGTRTIYLRPYKPSSDLWGTSASVSVTVNATPATPSAPVLMDEWTATPRLTRATPPATPPGTVWYWQGTDPNGQSTANADINYYISTSGTYYLKARSGAGCWGNSVGTNAVIVVPTTTGGQRKEPGVVTLSASIAAIGKTLEWYDAPAGGTHLNTGDVCNVNVSATTTFYVSARTNSVETVRVPVTATVVPQPIINTTSLYFYLNRTITLSALNNTYATYSWKRDGIEIATTATVVLTDQPGTYTVTVTKPGMTGSGTSDPLVLARAILNEVEVTQVPKEGVTTLTAAQALLVGERMRSTQYFGALGNPLQTIVSQGSPLQKDIIQFQEYDALGRQLKQYLPYISPAQDSEYRVGAISEQYQFYQNTPKVAQDTKPYTLAEVETSPLGRPLSQTGVGNAWHTNAKKVTMEYVLNRATDNIRIWTVNTTGLPVSTAAYGDYQLYVQLITDENGNKVKEYTDKLGRIILKSVQAGATTWLQTYSIYDDRGRLAFTLSPEGTRLANYAPNQAFLDQWMFQFKYDAFNRLVEYKAPAGGWMYTVFDVLDRPVMTQNADQRSRSEWAFVKYDVFGRPVVTGIKVIASSTRTSVQTSVDAQTYPYELATNNAVGYTLTRTYPSSVEAELLSISYYDNYAYLAYTGWDAEAHSFAFVPEQGSTTYETAITGAATGAKIRIIGSTKWLNAVQYYDKYYRPLQTISENHLNGLDRNTNKYNTLRQLIETRLAHHNQSVIVLRKLTYDHAGRVTKVYQNINSAPADQLVAQYEYNELGQLVDKKLHNTTGTAFLQSVDYRYTIRGWIASINNSQLNVNSATNDETGDYFGMEFLYNTTESGLSNTLAYNGNISAVKWKSPEAASGTTDQKSYKFTYDQADRLLTASSQMYNGSAWTKEAGAQNETMTYDQNGNIKLLQRNHRKHQLVNLVAGYISETVDNLTYTYGTAQGNQLTKVEDAVALGIGTGDFKNNATAATEYTYNTDGNLTADLNKGISSVVYNQLGKASQVNFTDGRKIDYSYNAAGSKLTMKTYSAGGVLQTTTDYVGGFVYENNVLSFFGSPEGRIVKNGSGFEYQYALADHQGNTRVVFSSVTPAPVAPQATFEGDANDGASQYINGSLNIVSFGGANHTAGGSKVVRMNQSNKIGPAKSVKVYPGDKVDIEVWEYHEGSIGFGTTSTPLTNLITSVAGAFGGVNGGPGESGMIYSGVNSAVTAFGTGGNQGDARPAAYLNYILFDKNYNVLDAGWQPAPSTTYAKQKLSFPTKEIKEAGYIYTWLSYDDDSNNYVYFDDFKVTHTKTNIIQYNEYYPFGLQAGTSWTRENNKNSFLYNEGSELNATSGWYETFFRGYDATLGRFNQVDPLAHASMSSTPYNYAYNDPVFYNDPNGDYPREVAYDMKVGGRAGQAIDPFGSSDGPSNYHGSLLGGESGWGQNMSAGQFIDQALNNSSFGGTWSNGSASFFTSDMDAASWALANGYYNYAGTEANSGAKLASIADGKGINWIYYKNGAWKFDGKGGGKYLGPGIPQLQNGGVNITVTNNIGGYATVRPYPDVVLDDNGLPVLYKVPLYEVTVSGVNKNGVKLSETLYAIRYGVQNDKNGIKVTGINSGTYSLTWGHMTRNDVDGWYVKGAGFGSVWLHAGPRDPMGVPTAAINCVSFAYGGFNVLNSLVSKIAGTNDFSTVNATVTFMSAVAPPLIKM